MYVFMYIYREKKIERGEEKEKEREEVIEIGREREKEIELERKTVREDVIKWRWSRNKRPSSYLLIEDSLPLSLLIPLLVELPAAVALATPVLLSVAIPPVYWLSISLRPL